ncbi:alpha/beta fold hydrolase [Undibacterium fentianense]|uniref:Alpha/beta hydrolase n=1 Tax=Undibacterium fentianense TaxID=2828728 RepID=A0A941E0Z2_9BURK|nr:alpha/beta hydrolase [Undibacterium fentianense]MBR7799047.1 alpha/beta hydrolase [Undibacterium fentianense]
MPQAIVHFCHGNSFPSGSYRHMLQHLGQHFDIRFLEMHGHNQAYPVTVNWPFLVQELIDTLEANYTEPVALLGHSLGGILSLMAASRRPDLVRCVLMIDSPVVTGWRSLILRGFRLLGLLERYSPAQFSIRRRMIWRDEQEAFEHFSSKEKFAIWPPEVLRDYVRAGLKPHPEGLCLKFAREIETQIYLTLPGNLGQIARQIRKNKVPIGFVGGTESVECRQGGLATTKRLCREHFVQLPAGHLLPMEMPERTADACRQMLEKLMK